MQSIFLQNNSTPQEVVTCSWLQSIWVRYMHLHFAGRRQEGPSGPYTKF